MNDIEREIEGKLDSEKLEKEEESINNLKINRNRDNDKKKMVMYIVIGILVLAIVLLIIYLVMNKKFSVNSDMDNINDAAFDDTDSDVNESVNSSLGYVSCDDNTSLLNVRNSTNGDIIDGLSCYKEVTIEEELEKTDACDKWYRISYTKNGSNYTGYVCGIYIKNLEISQEVMEKVKSIVDKANDYYVNSNLKAYCGTTSGSKMIDFGNNATGEYVKSEYKSIDELKSYLLSFLDENLVRDKLVLADIDNPNYYDNYYEIDGNLYCRNYAGKDYSSIYTNNYDIEVTNVSDDKISVNISYEYIDSDSDCDLDNLSMCSRYDFVYDIGKITIENDIITKMDFPE